MSQLAFSLKKKKESQYQHTTLKDETITQNYFSGREENK